MKYEEPIMQIIELEEVGTLVETSPGSEIKPYSADEDLPM